MNALNLLLTLLPRAFLLLVAVLVWLVPAYDNFRRRRLTLDGYASTRGLRAAPGRPRAGLRRRQSDSALGSSLGIPSGSATPY